MQNHLDNICEWTLTNKMMLNKDKCKYMIINFTKKYQYSTRLKIENTHLEQVNEVKLLGCILSDNLKWHANTSMTIKKGYQRMIILHKLFEFNPPMKELVNIYKIFIRNVLEQNCVIWHSSLTQGEIIDIERVQKVALRIILRNNYVEYAHALELTGLDKLEDRRRKLCIKFAKKSIRNENCSDLFPLKKKIVSRNNDKYQIFPAKKKRLFQSAVHYIQRLLNENT